MLTQKTLYSAAFSVLSFTLFAAAQTPASYKSAPELVKEGKFVSLEAGFSIDLPRQANSYETLEPIPYVSRGGRKFTWTNAAGYFHIEYVFAADWPTDPIANLATGAEKSIMQLSANGAKLIAKTAKTIDGKPALDLVFEKGENIFLIRSLWAGNQLFALSTYWPKTEDGVAQLRILNSFKWINSEAASTEKN